MSKLGLIRALYDYNEWANGHILEAAAELSEEELARKQGASYGSIQANLAHIMAAQVVWLARWTTGSNPTSVRDFQVQGTEPLKQAFAKSHAELRQFVASRSEADLDGLLAYRDSRGNASERVLWQLMVHLANHGTHHRAETAMALTALGHPLRDLDYVFFELERA